MTDTPHQTCACPCGKSTFHVKAKPMVRFLCHCNICQSLYQRPFADFTVLLSQHVELDQSQDIHFNKYRLPPALNRGICSACQTPVLGFLRVAPFLKLAFVPSSHYPDQSFLPEASGHIFYHRRAEDINDSLPKYNGYWPSEWVVSKKIISGLLHPNHT